MRFTGDSRPIARALSRAIRDLNPELIVIPETLQSRLDSSERGFGVLAKLVFGLGAVTIILAVIGIYGVVAFAVRQRTRELGIRVALGAGRLQIVRLVLASGMKPVCVGLVVGTVLSIGAARVMDRGFGNAPIPLNVHDPLAYIAGAGLLAFAAVAAMLGPARRAAAADPIKALRQE